MRCCRRGFGRNGGLEPDRRIDRPGSDRAALIERDGDQVDGRDGTPHWPGDSAKLCSTVNGTGCPITVSNVRSRCANRVSIRRLLNGFALDAAIPDETYLVPISQRAEGGPTRRALRRARRAFFS